MTHWTAPDLTAIDRDGELRVAAYRPDGSLRSSKIVWHVVVEDALYIRSVRGTKGAWYRGVQRTSTGVIDAGGVHADVVFTHDSSRDEAVDNAYHDKYGNGSAVRAITSGQARATTLRVDPR